MADQKTSIIIQAVDQTRAGVESATRSLAGLGTAGRTLNATLAALGFSLGALGFADVIKNTADFADEMGKAAQKVGVGIESLSALKYAADLSDVSFDSLQTGLKKLSVNMFEAAKGGKDAQAAFKQVGINVKDSSGSLKTADQVFAELADRFSKMSDGSLKTAEAVKLLGKSGQELIPLLNEGSAGLKNAAEEAAGFGRIITQQVAKASQDFNDNMKRMGEGLAGLEGQFAGPIIGALADFATRLLNASRAGEGFLGFIAGISTAPGDYGQALKDAEDHLKNVQKLRAELDPEKNTSNKINEFVFGDAKQLDADVAAAQKAVTTLQRLVEIRKANSLTEARNATQPASTDPKVLVDTPNRTPEIAKQAAEEYAKLYGELSNILVGTDQLTKSEQTLRDIQSGRFGDLLPWQQDQLANLAQEVNLNEQLANFQKVLDAGDARQAEQDQAAADGAAAYDQKQIDSYTSLRAQIEAANEDLNVALITNDKKRAEAQLKLENDRAVQRIYDMQLEGNAQQDLLDEQAHNYELKQKELAQNSSKNIDLVKELGLTFTSSFEDAISSGKSLSDVLKGLGVDIEKLVIRKSVTEPLVSGIDSLFSGFNFGDAISSFFGSADGNAFDQSGLIPFANGGIVNKPTPFMFGNGGQFGVMGEAGPEAILPLTRAPNGRLGVQSGGGCATNLNLQVNIQNNADVAISAKQRPDSNGGLIVDVVVEKINAMQARDIQRGGPLANALERTYGLNRAPGAG